ncbi:MAG: hypothetical protein ACRESZ_09160, partial [Methylococcales bacterium]
TVFASINNASAALLQPTNRTPTESQPLLDLHLVCHAVPRALDASQKMRLSGEYKSLSYFILSPCIRQLAKRNSQVRMVYSLKIAGQKAGFR